MKSSFQRKKKVPYCVIFIGYKYCNLKIDFIMKEEIENQKEPLCYYIDLDTGEEKSFPISKYKENIGYELNELPDINFTTEPIINNQGKFYWVKNNHPIIIMNFSYYSCIGIIVSIIIKGNIIYFFGL